MTETLTQRLQKAVALRDAINRWHSDAQVDMVLSKDHPLSIARYKDEMALYNAAPSIVQLAVELGAEVERLRTALDWYAQPFRYKMRSDPLTGFNMQSLAEADTGFVARQALGGTNAQ